MQAVVLEKTGGMENLKVTEVEEKKPKEEQIKVKVAYCGVCYRDIIDRRGGFPFIKLPIIPGHEFSGEVVEVGERVTRFKPGMHVVSLLRSFCGSCRFCEEGDVVNCEKGWEQFGLTVDGGYAPYVTATQNAFHPIPEKVPLDIAASLLCTAGTAYRGFVKGKLQKDERVAITGASGGVGLAALQLAKIFGAHTMAITSSQQKAEKLRRWADEVVVTEDGRWDKKVNGLDMVLEVAGSPTLEGSLKSLRTKGRVVIIGNVTGKRYPLNPGLVILKELEIIGSHTADGKMLEQILQWIEEGKYHHQIQTVLPLKEAARAQELLEQKKSMGRILLDCQA